MRGQFLTLGKQAIIYGLSGAAIQIVGLVTMPVFTRHFDAAEYGVLEVAMVGFTALIVAVDAGLGSALQREWFDVPEDDEEARRVVAATATWSSFTIAVLVALPILLLREPIAAWLFDDGGQSDVVALITLSVPLATLAIFFRDVMRVRFRPVHFAICAALAAAVAGVVGVVWVIAFDGGIAAVVAGLLIGQGVAAVYGWTIVRRDVPLRFSPRRLRALLAFGLPLVPATASMWAISFLDRVMLSQIDSLASTGEYAVGTRFASVLMFFTGAFATAYTPFLFHLHAAEPGDERALRARVLLYASTVFVGIGLALALFANEIANIVAPGYDSAYRIVGILCIGVAALGLLPIVAAGITISRKTKYIARYTVAVLGLNVLLCFALIPPFELVGAASATASSFVVLTIALLRRSQRLDRARFDVSRTVGIFVLGAVLMPVGLVTLEPPGLAVVVKLTALATFAAGVFAMGAVGPAERTEIRAAFVEARARLRREGTHAAP